MRTSRAVVFATAVVAALLLCVVAQAATYTNVSPIPVPRVAQREGGGECFTCSLASIQAYFSGSATYIYGGYSRKYSGVGDYNYSNDPFFKTVYEANGSTYYIKAGTYAKLPYPMTGGNYTKNDALNILYTQLKRGNPCMVADDNHASVVIGYMGNGASSLNANDFIVMEIKQWEYEGFTGSLNSKTLFNQAASNFRSVNHGSSNSFCYVSLSHFLDYTNCSSTNNLTVYYVSDTSPLGKQDIDVNAMLDHGSVMTNLGDCGVFDIYIDDKLEQAGVTDFNGSYAPGTKYKIVVHANPGYTYYGTETTWWQGLVSYPDEGEIQTHTTKITLGFTSDPTADLKVTGLLDGVETDDLTGYATFDVWVDGEMVAENQSNYSADHAVGLSYEIRNIRAADGKQYLGTVNGDESGVIERALNQVTLVIDTDATPTNEWQYVSSIPGTLDLDQLEIQSRGIYEITGETSPGEGWTQGELISSEYVNVGSPYTVLLPETTSDTLKLVKWEYFHWCKTSGGNWGNYAYVKDTYEHLDVISNTSSVTEANSGPDGQYTWYHLKWKSSGDWAYCSGGTTCTGDTHPNRTYVWYKRHTYQKMRLSQVYAWSKVTDWMNEPANYPDAMRVEYRFRLRVPEVDWQFTLPDDLTTIEELAFSGDTAINSIRLNNAVTTIGSGSFAGCANLRYVYIPDSVTFIATDAFDISDTLTLICQSDNAGAAYATSQGILYVIER